LREDCKTGASGAAADKGAIIRRAEVPVGTYSATSRRHLCCFAFFDSPGSRRQFPAGWAGGIRKKGAPRLRASFDVAAALWKTFEDADAVRFLLKPAKEHKR
jgi:hypothetical protein